MPKKTSQQLGDGITAKLREGLERAGCADVDELAAQAIAAQAALHGELLEAIPKLTTRSVGRYTAAVAAAIVGEALSPDLGRALLYAAQVISSARRER